MKITYPVRLRAFVIALLLFTCSFSAAFAGESGDAPIRIAIIDTGISTLAVDPSHADLGCNYVLPQYSTEDLLGHGTAIASIIAGSASAHVDGICPEAYLVPLVYRSVNEAGLEVSGDAEMVARAVYDAVDVYHCSIINISSGTQQDVDSLRKAVEYASDRNVLVVSCAGNYGTRRPDAVFYPGAYKQVLCVGSSKADGTRATFSQNNATVDLLAQGTALRIASVSGTLLWEGGTSYSTAIVSGAAARIWSNNPDLTAQQVREALLRCTQFVDGWKVLDLDAVSSYRESEMQLENEWRSALERRFRFMEHLIRCVLME